MATLTDAAQQLLDRLNTGEEVSYHDHHHPSNAANERQIRRRLAELRAAGVVIEERWENRAKRFYIPEAYRRHRVRMVELSEEEILALTVAAQAARATLRPTPLSEPLDTGFEQLRREIRSTPITFDIEMQEQQWHFGEAPSVPIRREVWTLLREAIEHCQRVRIDYYTASTEKESLGREVDPYGLAVRSGSWLLVAWCHQRNGMREFSLADIKRVSLFDPATESRPYFDLPEDFNITAHFRDRFNALAGGPLTTVTIQVEAHEARWFARKIYHASQHIKERTPDGRIVVTYTVSGLDEIRSFAQSWGRAVTVLGPPELVERMKADAGELVGRYGG